MTRVASCVRVLDQFKDVNRDCRTIVDDTTLPWFVQRFGYTIQGDYDKQLFNHRLEVQLQH